MRKISNSLTSSLKHLGLSVHICYKKTRVGGFLHTACNISRQMQITNL